MKFKALSLSLAVALSGSVVFGSHAMAEYPEKPIDLIIPFGPGSNTDTIGRLFLNAMSKAMGGATFVAKNVAGAGGTIGTAQLAAAKNDGHTLGLNPIATVTIQPHLRPLPYGKDSVEPICRLSDTPVAVMVTKDSPYNSIDDLIAAAKSGKVVSTGPAPGSVPHIAQAALAGVYGAKFVYLPSGGSSKAAKAMLGGQAAVMVQIIPNAKTYGMKLLAVMAGERSQSAPSIPTMKELGKDLSLSVWFGVFAPKGTPESVLKDLSAACAKAVKSEALNEGMTAAGILISYQDREEFSTFYNAQYEDNKSLLSLIGLGKNK